MDLAGLLAAIPDVQGLVPQEYLETLPPPLTATGAVFYGAWALFGVTVLRTIGGAVRSTDGNPTNAAIEDSVVGATKGTTTVGTTSNTGPSLSKGDHAAFTLPDLLPLSKGVRSVSHNEIHAIELGAVVGFLISWLASIGEQNTAVFLSVLFVVGALGYKRYRTKAFETIRLEPWYALLAFAIGMAVGWLFFTPDLATLTDVSPFVVL